MNEEDKFEEVLGKVNFFDYSSGLIAALVGSYVAYRVGLVSGYLHHRIDSSCRATVESFQSLVYRGFTIIVGLAFGFLSTNYSIFHGFRFLEFFSLSYFIYYFLFRRIYIKE